jgi:hypothetical protein
MPSSLIEVYWATPGGLRPCLKCGQPKEDSEYGRHPHRKDDKHYYCKACVRVASKAWYNQNKARHAAATREWYTANPERARELDRLRYAADPVKYKVRHADANRRRRVATFLADIDVGITLDKVFERDEGTCQICRLPCLRQQASIDHVTPLSKGGSHTWDNVQLAHHTCNARKGSRSQCRLASGAQ